MRNWCWRCRLHNSNICRLRKIQSWATAKDEDFIEQAVTISGFGITPITKKKFWWIKNNWGEKGFGRLYRRCDALHPKTGQKNFNLVIDVIACGVVKEKVLNW